ncbi:TonB family protein [Adhaeribacter sp. BT258]|uniref:TonB family protein n=1 Tax=Adhaeribacter terrigena TaxID=2793070 RepID=A0ABS1C5F2_9BACT|nr:energy transducer TonB [Adhaeribacter terrigena]MBK0404614.1 TonB family protein [Adhaeribacter terrigena]
MRFLIFALFATLALEVQAQEVKKIVDYNAQRRIREEFYVLKANEKIKHGEFKQINTLYKTVAEKGFYKNNLKDSTWTYYFPGTEHIMAQGNYLNDQKSGIWHECTFGNNVIYLSEKGLYKNGERAGSWQFFNAEGEVTKVYDYSLNKIYYEKPQPDSLEYEVLLNNNWEKRKLERAPSLIPDKFGNELISKPFINEIRYPMEAARAGVEGTVVIAFSVNEEGNPADFYVKTKLHPSLDAEAMRVSKLMSWKFQPGMLDGKPVTTRMVLPIKFSIQ